LQPDLVAGVRRDRIAAVAEPGTDTDERPQRVCSSTSTPSEAVRMPPSKARECPSRAGAASSIDGGGAAVAPPRASTNRIQPDDR